MNKRIPTILGLALTIMLVAILAFTTTQVQKVSRLFSRADEQLAPGSLGIGNITDQGFTVYWTTAKENTGVIYLGKTDKLTEGVFVDERGAEHTTHLVRISGLSAATKYYFKIGSEATISEITTLAKPTTIVVEPIFGKVLDQTGSQAPGVIAIWEASSAGKIVAMSKIDGTYLLPIGNGGVEKINEETITLEGGSAGRSIISCKDGFDRPLPTVKLGDNKDCGKALTAGFKRDRGLQVNISDGETVNSPLPTFFGSAGPSQTVRVEVRSELPYSGTVIANPDGTWSWTPPANLTAGQHSVTITVQNVDGTTQTVTRTFYVGAGESILPLTSGTPSGTITPEPFPTIPSTGSAITPLPTVFQPLPTGYPTASPVVYPPSTGRIETTIALLILGAVLTSLGVIFLF